VHENLCRVRDIYSAHTHSDCPFTPSWPPSTPPIRAHLWNLHTKKNHCKQVHRATLSVSDDVQPTPVAVLRAPQGSVSAEAEVLLKLGRHPHLVRFFGQCHDGDDELLLTELAPIGSLTDLMQVTVAHQHACCCEACLRFFVLLDTDPSTTPPPLPPPLSLRSHVHSLTHARITTNYTSGLTLMVVQLSQGHTSWPCSSK
jgi:hypothetical protein